ncbi:MAG: hypothetical protein COB35_13555 [Gammaproteobacteria bacterium]|nr:MAG: hypothetical protein COB35_13555 [Gammaproteobacteria bacterium]
MNLNKSSLNEHFLDEQSLKQQPIGENVLFHEQQLGVQLNQCVHSKRRADFALMLALLTDDVREHSQFFLPQEKSKNKEYSDELLRKAFHLPKIAPLALEKNTDIEKYSQAELIAKQQLPTLHLKNALTPLPLSFRHNKKHLPSSVLADTSIHCQNRYQQQMSNSVVNETSMDKSEQNKAGQKKAEQDKANLLNSAAFFNAKAWLDNIQNSLVNGANVSLRVA